MNPLAVIAVAFSIFSSDPMVERHARAYAETAQVNNVEMPAVRVRVVDRDCPFYGDGSRVSCVYMHKPWVIFSSQRDEYVILHELGHVYDFSNTMESWQRYAFRITMRYYRGSWYRSPASERFADAYASCALGVEPGTRQWREGGYGYRPTPEQHRRVCQIIAPRR